MKTESPKPEPTAHVIKIAHALEERGAQLKLEHWDGHKHIDIFIPSARLYIEVNGLQHYTNPDKIVADLKRMHFSDGDDFVTMSITNQLIDTHLDNIADAIVEVVKRRSVK